MAILENLKAQVSGALEQAHAEGVAEQKAFDETVMAQERADILARLEKVKSDLADIVAKLTPGAA